MLLFFFILCELYKYFDDAGLIVVVVIVLMLLFCILCELFLSILTM